MRRLVIITLLFCSVLPAFAGVVDEQEPNLKETLNHLATMSHALKRARQEALLAKRSNALVDFNYARLIADIEKIEQEVDRLLTPHNKRLYYKNFIPDSVYFMPKDRIEDYNPIPEAQKE